MSQTKITSNIEELKNILKEIYKKWEEATEFLEALESNVSGLQDDVINLTIDNQSKENMITELEEIMEDRSGLENMDCGIGVINYEEPGNLVLQDIMENLEAAIKKTNPRKVNEILEAI